MLRRELILQPGHHHGADVERSAGGGHVLGADAAEYPTAAGEGDDARARRAQLP